MTRPDNSRDKDDSETPNIYSLETKTENLLPRNNQQNARKCFNFYTFKILGEVNISLIILNIILAEIKHVH